MKLIGNLLWHFPCFGFVSAFIIYFFGLFLTITIVAAPIGLGLIELGKFLLWPFGNSMVNKTESSGVVSAIWEAYSTLIMILYIPFGILFTIIALFQIFFLFVSIIGIPAALVIIKSLGTFFNPVGKKCVPYQ